MKRFIGLLCISLLAPAASLYGDSGGTDAKGCHTNRKTGEYHCHQPKAVAAKFTISPVATRNQREISKRFVARVIDGDTIELSGGERVRLIGVDTPETVHPHKAVEAFGKEASAFTKREINGQAVRLEYDQSSAATGYKDKYGRTLAYVYRVSDEFFLNVEIIKHGYGHSYTSYPFKYMEDFREYDREARDNGRGLWAWK